MTPEEAAQAAVAADLASARFLVGVLRKRWRQVLYDFPILIVAVSAIEPDGAASEYCFRFELSGFRGAAPEVRIWDLDTNSNLAAELRPKGSRRLAEALKSWGSDTVYRPWERHAGAHNNWAQSYPELAWNPRRDLTFILEDLHGLLTSNSLARPPAALA